MDFNNDKMFDLSEALDYFSEDAVLRRQAEGIFNRIHGAQARNCPSGRLPFTEITDQNTSPEEREILKRYNQAQQEKIKQKAQGTDVNTAEPSSDQPTFMPAVIASGFVQSLRNLIGPKKPKSGAEEPSSYELMCAFLANDRLVVYDGHFYRQEGAVFKLMDEKDLQGLLFVFLEPLLATGRNQRIIDSVIDLLKKNPKIKAVCTTENPDRVFLLNGAYYPSRHELLPIQPTDFFISYLSIYYSPDATACPCFDRYVETVSGGDPAVKRLIWEVLGYLLSNDMAGKAFFVLQGVGDSGKSVFGNLVASFFNTEALAYLDIFRFKDRFSTSALKGKYLNICMDLPRAKISREAIGVIKMLTGDDTITIEEKFRKAEPYKPTCKLLFGSNFPLMPADLDDALLARLVTIPFRYSIPKDQQDKHLLDKLLVERCAIAVKALDAYLALKQRNYQFTPVQGVCGMTGYVKESELMETFVREQCVFQPEHYTFTADLQAAYNAFRIAHNVPPIEDTTAFSRQFNSFCAGQVTPKRVRCGRRNLNGYAGVGLRGPVPC